MMCRRTLILVSCFAITPSVAAAQTTTADGVEAFLQGNYHRAAQILQPIVEDWPSRHDPIADFFMAKLYRDGLGIAPDDVRACALYRRSRGEGPLGTKHMQLFLEFDRTLTDEQRRECEGLARTGLAQSFQPVTFSLGIGHSIAFDREGITIEHAGKRSRIAGEAGFPDVVILSIEHKELLTGTSKLVRRHFIEQFVWMPVGMGQAGEWTLAWAVSEVVRDQLRAVVEEEVLRVTARRPPELPAQEIRGSVRLSVNNQGVAEWAILGGDKPRSGLITSIEEWMLAEAQSKEDRERDAARAAARASVDRSLTRDRYRAPSLTYIDAEGCGGIRLYGWSADHTETITVRADRTLLQLTTGSQTYEITAGRHGLEIAVQVNERPIGREPSCYHGLEAGDPETWRAISGRLTIELSEPGVRAAQPDLYRAMIRIEGGEFLSTTGARVRQARPITLVALVGRVSG